MRDTPAQTWPPAEGPQGPTLALLLLVLAPIVLALTFLVVYDSHEAAQAAGPSSGPAKLSLEEFTRACIACLKEVVPDPSKLVQITDALSSGHYGRVAALPSSLDQVW